MTGFDRKRSLKEAIEDVPKDWEAFWASWCDRVQPTARRATNRGDLCGVGLPMSDTGETLSEFNQFVAAYDADPRGPAGDR